MDLALIIHLITTAAESFFMDSLPEIIQARLKNKGAILLKLVNQLFNLTRDESGLFHSNPNTQASTFDGKKINGLLQF